MNADTGQSRYRIWQPEQGQTEDDARTICALGPMSAVEAWAEWDDGNSAEYRIVGGSDALVFVRTPYGELLKVVVRGESVPQYTAELACAVESPTGRPCTKKRNHRGPHDTGWSETWFTQSPLPSSETDGGAR